MYSKYAKSVSPINPTEKGGASLSTETDSIKRFQNVFHELGFLYDKVYSNYEMKSKGVK